MSDNEMRTPETFLIEEKYHPDTLEDVVLPKRLKDMFRGIVDSGNITNYLFAGSPGCGKTTTAVAICKMLGLEYTVIEASVNNGVDYIRENIFEMARCSTTNGKYKVIILDEADYMSVNAQAALRNVINVTQSYCRYILCVNYPEKIIPAIRSSRCPTLKFEFNRDEILKEMAPHLWKRIVKIAKEENYRIESPQMLQKFMVENLPNIRFILKSIQMMAGMKGGVIPENISMNQSTISVDNFKSICASSYDEIVKFVYRTPQDEIMRFVQENLTELASDQQKQLQIITWAAHYQSQYKGIEELYTIAFLMNLKELIK